MNNKNQIVYALAAFLLIAGGIFVYNSTKKSGTVAEEQTAQTESKEMTKEDTGDVLGESKDTTDQNKTPSENPTSMANCTRNFDENKLKTAKVELANQKVELDVAGYGKLGLEFYEKDAPKAVENFLRLVNSGFYDCLTFHRISKGFVIQGGDPKGDGTGGISAFGTEFEDELNPETPSYKAGYKHGVLAMANRGPNTNSSQFFILLSDYPLDHKYTIFGKVTSGLDVVDKIGNAEIIPNPYMGGADGAPKEKIVINKASIVTK